MTASSVCSPELWRRLTAREVNYCENVAEIVTNPALRGEVAEALPTLARAAEPCGDRAVIATLAPLVSVYGVADRSAAEWATFWRFYVETLSWLPLEALQAGVKAYNAKPDSEFFPKPGPLRALCEDHAAKLSAAKRRAEIAAEAKTPQDVEATDDFRYLEYLRDVGLDIRKREVAA
jgi:hypothetical protein